MYDNWIVIHMALHPPVFTELLIGISPLAITPPEDNVLPRVLHSAGFYGEERDATTEMVYGAGLETELVGVERA